MREIENFYQKNNASTSTTNNTNYYKTEITAGKFYQFIYQKMIDRLITVKQYEEISEKMKSKSFTIEAINQFCENNNIPTFREDELFRIAKKDKNTVDPNSEYIGIFKIIEANTDLTKNEIEKALTNTLTTFNEAFGFIKNKSSFGRHQNKAHFTLHFFKNEKSFYDYTKSKEINLVGYTPNNNIYVYLGGRFQERLNRTIRHEFVHVFMNYSGVGEVINSFSILREGIPTYVAGLSKGENAIHFLSDLKNHLDEKNFNKSLTLKNLLSDQFLKDNNLSHYIAGPVVIAYFEDMFPNVIDELLYDTKDMVEENKEEF